MDFEFSKGNRRGQNSLDWKVTYIIGKLLEHRCLKWPRMTHLDNWNTNYGQKKGQESNWQFDFRPLKVENCPNFLASRWRATYFCKVLDEGYNFAVELISIGGLHTKVWAPKSRESQLWKFRDSHLGVPGQNAIWMLVPWPSRKYFIYNYKHGVRPSVRRRSGSVFCGGTGHKNIRRQNRPGQSDSENGVRKTGFGKTQFEKKRDSKKWDSKKRDSENLRRKICDPSIRLSCRAGQGVGQGGRAAGQGVRQGGRAGAK